MKTQFTVDLPAPPPNSGSLTIYMALRVVRDFGGRTPTVAQLQERFGMSRATAYRWRAAFMVVNGEAA